MSRKPFVSVIVPTYADRAPRLSSALASIWAQDGLGERFDVDVIVVDDASWGPTDEVVRRFPGTRYVRLEASRGVAAARNAGIAQARGDYLAFMDDDDVWLPRRLSLHVAALERAHRPEVAYSQHVTVYNDGTSQLLPHGHPPSGWIFEWALTGEARLLTMTVPTDALEAVGNFDETLPNGEDTDWAMRLALRFPFRYVPGPVTVYLPSNRDWTTWADEKIHSWLIRRDKILTLVRGEPNEAEIGYLVLSRTWAQVVSLLMKAGRSGDARAALLGALEEFPPLGSDIRYRSRMKGLTLELASADRDPAATRSLFADLRRVAGRGSPRRRWKMRMFLADLWTELAMRHSSGDRRDVRFAASSAANAILQNPMKPLKRPGLVRLLLRPLADPHDRRMPLPPTRDVAATAPRPELVVGVRR